MNQRISDGALGIMLGLETSLNSPMSKALLDLRDARLEAEKWRKDWELRKDECLAYLKVIDHMGEQLKLAKGALEQARDDFDKIADLAYHCAARSRAVLEQLK